VLLSKNLKGQKATELGQSAGKDNTMNDTDRAWLAGIWEGEGSVMLYSRPVRDNKLQITPAMEVGNTDLHIVNKIRKLLEDMGCFYSFYERMPKKGTRKFYHIRTQNAYYIKTTLENILPFMVGEKKAYGETLLSFVTKRIEKSKDVKGGLKHTPYDEDDYDFVRSSTTTRETPYKGEDIV
jgi:hypothetical protein